VRVKPIDEDRLETAERFAVGVAKWSRMHGIVWDELGFDSSATRAMSFDETLPPGAARRGTIAKTRHHPHNTEANTS